MYKRADLPQPLCLTQAAASGDVDKVISIVSSLDIDKTTLNQALLKATEHCSTASDHIQCVEILLGKGAAVNYKSEEGMSPLMKACELGQIQLVELLWQRGGKIGDRGSEGRTPLHFSVDTNFGDNSDVVQFLLAHGADVNSPDHLGRTPLHLAAQRGAIQSLNVLVAAHARLKAYDKRRKTPLDLAVENRRESCVDALKAAGNTVKPVKPGVATDPPTPHQSKDDPGTVVEIEEELETKSGSSYTSNRGCGEAGGCTEQPWGVVLRGIDCLLTGKRQELREETVMIDSFEQEMAVLQREKNCVEWELNRALIQAEREGQGMRAELEKETGLVKQMMSLKSTTLPGLLMMKKKAGQGSPQGVIHSLHSDISQFLSELDSWQRTISPTLTRAVERWRSFVALHLPSSQVKVYGSFANSLHLPSSDVDVMVTSPGFSACAVLEALESHCKSEPWIASTNLIPAAYIPVLQLVLLQDGYSLRLDVTVSEAKHRGGKCTLVVRRLLREVPRLREVFLTLKQLFHVCEANVPFRGGLGSYSLFVMTAALMKREVMHTSAEYVYRFFHYYGHECQYNLPIAVEVVDCLPYNYPVLFVADPSAEEFNTARATQLPFLVVRGM